MATSLSAKSIAPAAIQALKEALVTLYWYKADLRSFLTNCLNQPALIVDIDWSGYKRNIVGNLVDRLANRQDLYQAELLRLMTEVARVDSFQHLERLEDGQEKAHRAREAVGALRQFTVAHDALVEEHQRAEQRKAAAHEERLRNAAVSQRLDELQMEYYALLTEDAQRRGYLLEKLLRNLFDLFDLDPKASFKVTGEQIDGAFSFDTTDYLLEARWRNQQADASDLDSLAAKIERRLDNTLGLFLSINGFSEDAPQETPCCPNWKYLLKDPRNTVNR
jgi:hypothetical protein